jgi:23S rRNA pseudouridine955/2504/2580 synthase
MNGDGKTVIAPGEQQVAEDEAGLRLDRWFRRRFPGVPHSLLEKLLRTGKLRIDGKRARANTRLVAGQVLRVPAIEQRRDLARSGAAPQVGRDDTRRLQESVLYKDRHVLAINKPPGLAVQGGSRTTRHLDAMLDVLQFESPERPRLVHRLDKDTSGVLLLARNARAASTLTRAFRHKAARKVYWALVVGVPRPREGRIELALAKKPVGHGGERVSVAGEKEGKRAVTLYRVVEAAGSRVAWLELEPLTGRTHQLRAHCAALGTPILGDGKYGGEAAHIFSEDWGRRLQLLAREIEIEGPGKKPLHVVAPLPEHMRDAFSFFGFDDSDGGGGQNQSCGIRSGFSGKRLK